MNILYRLWLVGLTFFTIVLTVLLFALFVIIVLPWYILKGDIKFLIKVIDNLMTFLDKLGNKFDEQ
jgi:hypothetical protein